MGSYFRCLRAAWLGGLLLAVSASASTVADFPDALTKADEPPVPVKLSPPEYPKALLKQNIRGLVSLVIVVDEKGDVVAAEVSKASQDEFCAPALAAARRWKFRAAKVGGQAVKVRVTVPVQFAID